MIRAAISNPPAPGLRPTRGFGVAVLLLVSTLSSACGEEPAAAAEPPPSSPRTLAKVNGKPLTSFDLEAFIQFSGTEAEAIDYRHVLDELVTQEIVFQAARNEGFRVQADEIDRALGQWFGSPEDDIEPLRGQVEAYLTVQKFLRQRIRADHDVSLLDLQRYYEAHFDEFEVDDQLRVLEILVAERSQAEKIRSQLAGGDFRGFREAARAHSIGLTAATGGELGVFEPGDLPKRFEELVFSLKVGEIGPVFQTEHGFHIFLVEERTPRHEQKFYEVKKKIFHRLIAEKEREQLEQLLTQLREAAVLEMLPAPSFPNGELNND